MATTGTDSGGKLTIISDEAAVLVILRAQPDIPTGVDRWSLPLRAGAVKASTDAFSCDPKTWREALAAGTNPADGLPYSSWEAGKPGGHFPGRNARDLSAVQH